MFTEGKWEVLAVENCGNPFGDGKQYLVQIKGATIAAPNSKADANLISAAPDMYEALKIAWASLRTYGEHPLIDKQIQSAIQKAEGKE